MISRILLTFFGICILIATFFFIYSNFVQNNKTENKYTSEQIPEKVSPISASQNKLPENSKKHQSLTGRANSERNTKSEIYPIEVPLSDDNQFITSPLPLRKAQSLEAILSGAGLITAIRKDEESNIIFRSELPNPIPPDLKQRLVEQGIEVIEGRSLLEVVISDHD